MNSLKVRTYISFLLILPLLFAVLLCHFVPGVSAAESVQLYQYGDNVLPDIYSVYTPDLQSIYPYCFLWAGMGGYELSLSSVPLYYESGYGLFPDASFGDIYMPSFIVPSADVTTGWREASDHLVSYDHRLYGVFWANEPLYDQQGTLTLPYIAPVPVDSPDVESSIVSVSVSSLTSAVYPGSTVHFDAVVSGTGSYDSSVTWSVAGAASADTSIDGSGNLTIADNETAAQLTVTATSVQDTSVIGSASIAVQPFPNVDDLTIVPGKETALQGVAFVQQFSLAYKDGTAYTGPSPVWSFEVTPPDSPFPDLDGEYSWVTISDTGILSISADAPADYMVVVTAKLGDQYLTGGRVIISTETNDYLKDIINGTEEQKGQADSFGDKTDEQFADLEEDVSLIDQVTMPDIDNIDLNIDTQVSGDGMTALAMLLGLFMNSQVISTSMTFAFLFALVAFVIFGKR